MGTDSSPFTKICKGRLQTVSSSKIPRPEGLGEEPKPEARSVPVSAPEQEQRPAPETAPKQESRSVPVNSPQKEGRDGKAAAPKNRAEDKQQATSEPQPKQTERDAPKPQPAEPNKAQAKPAKQGEPQPKEPAEPSAAAAPATSKSNKPGNSDNRTRREEGMAELRREIKARDRKDRMKPLGLVAASLVVIAALIGGIYLLATHNGEDKSQDAESSQTSEKKPTAQPLALKRDKPLPEEVSCTYTPDGKAAKPVSLPEKTEGVSTNGTVKVSFDTSAGPIGLDLDRSVAPCTVNAFEHLAKSNYFDDTVCHRMTKGMLNVLQCGDPTGKGNGGPGFKFPNEYPTDEANGAAKPVTYPSGTVAMANAGKDTNGSQFFLNYDDSELPPNYTYFGKIDSAGAETLGKIKKEGLAPGAQQGDGLPAKEVRIKTAKVE